MIADLPYGVDQWSARGDPAARGFSTFGFHAGKLAVVESVNHAAAKRTIGTAKTLTPEGRRTPRSTCARWRSGAVEAHSIRLRQEGEMAANCRARRKISPPRIDNRDAGALVIARVAGQESQPVAERRRRDDQIRLRVGMPRLAAFLDH